MPGRLGRLVAAFLLVGTLVFRAEVARADQSARAKELFLKGVSAYSQQNYVAALVYFRKSYELKPKPVVLYNIAMCHRALFQYKASIEAFKKYLATMGRKIRRSRRREVESYIREMEAKLGRIALDVKPDGAEVLLDGRPVGRTPLPGELTVDPGTHVVVVRKEGYETFRKEVELADGQTLALAKVLQPKARARKGTVVVRSGVPGSKVSVDGALAVPLPATLELSAGRHVLVVTAPGHQPKSMVVEVTEGMSRTFDVQLQEEPARPRPRPRPEQRAAARQARQVPVEATRPVTVKQRSKPVYKSWWFWTAIGGAVLTGVVLGAYFGAKAAEGPDFDKEYSFK